MARKTRTFADKLKKKKHVVHCPKCKGPIQPVLYIKSVRSETTGAWKFRQNLVGVCKCNQSEINK